MSGGGAKLESLLTDRPVKLDTEVTPEGDLIILCFLVFRTSFTSLLCFGVVFGSVMVVVVVFVFVLLANCSKTSSSGDGRWISLLPLLFRKCGSTPYGMSAAFDETKFESNPVFAMIVNKYWRFQM